MNERIKKLAEQAGVKYSLWVGSKLAAYMTHDELAKFAELIVREVFDKIEDERFEIYQPVKESVMKHFGVEK